MPTRALKESITTSPEIDKLSPEEERFFYRLLVVCDDHGCMDARPHVLRSRCFPLKIDDLKNDDIQKWLDVLSSEGIDLVRVYERNGRKYLQVTNWKKHQQIRAHRRKYPAPSWEDPEIVGVVNDEENGNGNESKVKPDKEKVNVPYDDIVDLYHLYCTSLPSIRVVSDKRKKLMRARWNKYNHLDIYKELFKKAEASDFLSGRAVKGESSWTCNFDWLLNENNMLKVLEGNYDNKKSGSTPPTEDATWRATKRDERQEAVVEKVYSDMEKED